MNMGIATNLHRDNKKNVIVWMLEDEALHGVRGLPICAARAFLEHFQRVRTTNLVKVDCWWKLCKQFFHEGVENQNLTISTNRSQHGLCKCLLTKAICEGGQK